MQRTPLIILGLTLAAGLAIAGVLVATAGRARLAAGRNPAPSGRTVAGVASPGPAVGSEAAPLPADGEIRVADAWRCFRSDDLKLLVANLRAAGFPAAIVRAVAGAILHEQFAAGRRQIMGEQPEVPYWKPGSALSTLASPQMAALRELARQEQDALKQLLGPDSATAELDRFVQQRLYGNLPAEKIDSVQRVLQDYNDLRAQIVDAAGGGASLLPWDREKLALLDKEQHDDLAAVLTPDELRQYDLHRSASAQRVRNQLAYFDPTEQEFLAVYDLQSGFDQAHNPLTTAFLPPDQMRQLQADRQQLQAQIKAALGDQRYRDYQQSTDNGFVAASRIASALQLPKENAAAAWSLEQDTQQQASALRGNREMTGVQRLQSLQALASQADQQLTALLTPAGVDAYKQTAGGVWLRNLELTTRRAPPAAPAGSSSSSAPSPPRN